MKRFVDFLKKLQSLDESYKPIVAPTAKEIGIKMQGGFAYHPSVYKFIDYVEEDVIPKQKLKKMKSESD
jgi:hypothetical protein